MSFGQYIKALKIESRGKLTLKEVSEKTVYKGDSNDYAK